MRVELISNYGIKYFCLKKRSPALRGRNLTRDSQIDGASMTLRGCPGPVRGTGALLFGGVIERQSDSLENPGVWGRAPVKEALVPFSVPARRDRTNPAARIGNEVVGSPRSDVLDVGKALGPPRFRIRQRPACHVRACVEEASFLPTLPLVTCLRFSASSPR